MHASFDLRYSSLPSTVQLMLLVMSVVVVHHELLLHDPEHLGRPRPISLAQRKEKHPTADHAQPTVNTTQRHSTQQHVMSTVDVTLRNGRRRVTEACVGEHT